MALWPSRAELARDLGRSAVTVQSWWFRARIPGEADVEIIDAARARGFAVTFEELARARHEMANTPPSEVPAE